MKTIVYETESMVRRTVGERTENKRSQVLPKIFEPNTTIVNIFFLVVYKDIVDPNWHISFMTLTKKGIQYYSLT